MSNPVIASGIPSAIPSICATPIFLVRFAESITDERCGFNGTFLTGDLKNLRLPTSTIPLIRLPGTLSGANAYNFSSDVVDRSFILYDVIFCTPFAIASTDRFFGSISFRLPGVNS